MRRSSRRARYARQNLEDVFIQIERANMPPGGWKAGSKHPDQIAARRRVQALKSAAEADYKALTAARKAVDVAGQRRLDEIPLYYRQEASVTPQMKQSYVDQGYRRAQVEFEQQRHMIYQKAQMEHQDDIRRLRQAKELAYNDGFQAGLRQNSMNHQYQSQGYTYNDVEKARLQGFQAGVAAGSASAQASTPRVNEADIRKQVMDQVYEQCRVVEESNPNMKPGISAVKKMFRKIK